MFSPILKEKKKKSFQELRLFSLKKVRTLLTGGPVSTLLSISNTHKPNLMSFTTLLFWVYLRSTVCWYLALTLARS